MTKEEAISQMQKATDQGIAFIDCTFTEKCDPAFKEEVTVVQLTRDYFHWKEKSPNEIVDYKLETIIDLGLIGGIKPVNTHSTKISKYSFVSTSEMMRPKPDGSRDTKEETYEYDAEVRFDDELANDLIYNNGKFSWNGNGTDKGQRYYEGQKLKRLSNMATHGRSKADSGAEKRAIIKLLNLPPSTTKIKGQYKMVNIYLFISKVVPNLDNPQMREKFLNHSFGITQSIYGEQAVIEQTGFEDSDTIVGEVNNDDNSSFIEQFLNSDLAKRPESRIAIEWTLNNPSVHEGAVSILKSLPQNSNPDQRVKCIADLYMLNPLAEQLQIPNTNKTISQNILDAGDNTQVLVNIISECCKILK